MARLPLQPRLLMLDFLAADNAAAAQPCCSLASVDKDTLWVWVATLQHRQARTGMCRRCGYLYEAQSSTWAVLRCPTCQCWLLGQWHREHWPIVLRLRLSLMLLVRVDINLVPSSATPGSSNEGEV